MFIFTTLITVIPLVIAFFTSIPALRVMSIMASGFVIFTVGIQYNYNMILECSKLEKEGFTYKKPSKSNQYSRVSNNKSAPKYAPKVVENKDYDALIKKLKYCMRNKLLSREDVLALKEEITSTLASYNKDYSKFKFENDLHEIYVKLKNKHLNSENYVNLNHTIDTLIKN